MKHSPLSYYKSSVSFTIACPLLVEIVDKFFITFDISGVTRESVQKIANLRTKNFTYVNTEKGKRIVGRDIESFMTSFVADILSYISGQDAFVNEYANADDFYYLYFPLVQEMKIFLKMIIADTRAIYYTAEHTCHGEPGGYLEKEFKELHPQKKYEDYNELKYFSTFVYEKEDDKETAEFDHYFALGPAWDRV